MTGTVYKSTGSWYFVKSEKGDLYQCRIKGKFRIKGIKSTNPIAVGDSVEFDIETKGDEEIGVIKLIHERTNYIVRKSTNLSKQQQILAGGQFAGQMGPPNPINLPNTLPAQTYGPYGIGQAPTFDPNNPGANLPYNPFGPRS